MVIAQHRATIQHVNGELLRQRIRLIAHRHSHAEIPQFRVLRNRTRTRQGLRQAANHQANGIPLKRQDVYICNVVKCRPPENRTPEPEEMAICGQFLFRQLTAIHPKAICALGATAAKALLARKEGVTRMRGNWFKWNDIPVMVTYHPSYLLRAYNQQAKREAWEDLKKVLHFVYD